MLVYMQPDIKGVLKNGVRLDYSKNNCLFLGDNWMVRKKKPCNKCFWTNVVYRSCIHVQKREV